MGPLHIEMAFTSAIGDWLDLGGLKFLRNQIFLQVAESNAFLEEQRLSGHGMHIKYH